MILAHSQLLPKGVKLGLTRKYSQKEDWKDKRNELRDTMETIFGGLAGVLTGVEWSPLVVNVLRQVGEWEYFDPADSKKDLRRKKINGEDWHIRRFQRKFGTDYNLAIKNRLGFIDPHYKAASSRVKQEATGLLLFSVF